MLYWCEALWTLVALLVYLTFIRAVSFPETNNKTSYRYFCGIFIFPTAAGLNTVLCVLARLSRPACPTSCFLLPLLSFTSTGDALLVDLAQVSHTALVWTRPRALPVHRRPRQERCLWDSKLLQDAWGQRSKNRPRSELRHASYLIG